MAGLYNEIIGAEDASFSFGGPNFLDVHGFMLDNLFGDLSVTGSNGANGTVLRHRRHSRHRRHPVHCHVRDRLRGRVRGDDRLRVGRGGRGAVGCAVGDGADVREQPAAVPASGGCERLHRVVPVRAQVRVVEQSARVWRRGRRAAADAHSHRQHEPQLRGVAGDEHQRGTGLPGSRGGRLSFSGNAEQLLSVKFSGNSWISQAAGSTPANVISNMVPVANWRGNIYIGGTAPGNLVTTSASGPSDEEAARGLFGRSTGSRITFIIARGPIIGHGRPFSSLRRRTNTPFTYATLGYQYVYIVLQGPGSAGSAVARLAGAFLSSHEEQARPLEGAS